MGARGPGSVSSDSAPPRPGRPRRGGRGHGATPASHVTCDGTAGRGEHTQQAAGLSLLPAQAAGPGAPLTPRARPVLLEHKTHPVTAKPSAGCGSGTLRTLAAVHRPHRPPPEPPSAHTDTPSPRHMASPRPRPVCLRTRPPRGPHVHTARGAGLPVSAGVPEHDVPKVHPRRAGSERPSFLRSRTAPPSAAAGWRSARLASRSPPHPTVAVFCGGGASGRRSVRGGGARHVGSASPAAGKRGGASAAGHRIWAR